MTNLPIIWRPQPNNIYQMDALQFAQQIEPRTVQTVITSPPYWGLRDYGYADQWGSEPTMQAYIERMVQLFRAIREALRDDGTVWLNLGDGYANDGKWVGSTGGKHVKALHGDTVGRHKVTTGLKPKDLIGIPWRVALALQADGWYLRSDIIWAKSNPMPESVTDRPTKAHEYIFLLSKSERYYYDHEAIKDPATDASIKQMKRGVSPDHKNANGAPGQTPHSLEKPRPNTNKQDAVGNRRYAGFNQRYEESPGGKANKRTVWTVATQPFPGAHFAVFPEALITPCVLAGAPKGGLVYDPFMGAGTTAKVAKIHGRDYIGSELNQEYIDLAHARLDGSIKRYVAQKNAQPLEDLPLFAHAKTSA